jgi:hypothetical protein
MLRSSALYVLSFRACCTGSIASFVLCTDNGRFLAALRYGRVGMLHPRHRQARRPAAGRRVCPAAAVAVRPRGTAGMTSDLVTLLRSFALGILNRRA